MIYSSDRATLRRTFADAWRKRRDGSPLDPQEARIADVVAAHPEYHALLDDPRALDRDFTPEGGEANPFLHMAMHLTLGEQRATDRPPGVARELERLARRLGDVHAAEHAAMECLGRVLWESGRSGRMPDEKDYLECMRGRRTRG